MQPIRVSTPSRICLFGEHQDYLGLEVVAMAINLRFYATITPRTDGIIDVRIRDRRCDTLGDTNKEKLYERVEVDLSQPIRYSHNRDYIKSSINLLMKLGVDLWPGYTVVMDSQIPIGKGMCSSTTMIMVLLRALMEAAQVPGRDNPDILADLGFRAEVVEFGEPGGMMDHYTSAYGRLVNISFSDGVKPSRLSTRIPGCFILFDSLTSKDTIKVLSNAKKPVIDALEQLNRYGIHSVKDFYEEPNKLTSLSRLDAEHRRKLMASIDNYAVLREAVWMLKTNRFDNMRFGQLLNRHHENLRDGLDISTTKIETILQTAMQAGALGGKINGSGGGGCCFVYCMDENAPDVLAAVEALGYPGTILSPDDGTRKEPTPQ